MVRCVMYLNKKNSQRGLSFLSDNYLSDITCSKLVLSFHEKRMKFEHFCSHVNFFILVNVDHCPEGHKTSCHIFFSCVMLQICSARYCCLCCV